MAHERQVGEGPQGDAPVTNLIPEQPEVRADSADAGRKRDGEDGDGHSSAGGTAPGRMYLHVSAGSYDWALSQA